MPKLIPVSEDLPTLPPGWIRSDGEEEEEYYAPPPRSFLTYPLRDVEDRRRQFRVVPPPEEKEHNE